MRIDDNIIKIILNNISDGIIIRNRTTGVEYWNRTMELLTGYTFDEVKGRVCTETLMHTDENGEFLCKTQSCPYAKALNSDGIFTDFLYIKHKNGHRFPVVSSIIKIDSEGLLSNFIEIVMNKSNDFYYQERIRNLQNLALIDPLTRIPNRRFMKSELAKHIEKAKRENLSSAIIFMDIDDFKQFNDNYGHNVGDELLVNIAKTLINAIRKYDIIGRWGGEEFIALVEDVDAQILEKITNKILKLVRATSILHNGKYIGSTISIGAHIVDLNMSVEKNIEAADILMYKSKQNGKNRITIG